jgi:hypothetical protein
MANREDRNRLVGRQTHSATLYRAPNSLELSPYVAPRFSRRHVVDPTPRGYVQEMRPDCIG